MSNKKSDKKVDPLKAPLQSEIPPSECLWEGTHHFIGRDMPCRLVLRWVAKLYQGAEKYVNEPEYVYERATGWDAMGGERYESAAFNDIPAQFFVDIAELLRNRPSKDD